MLALTLAGIHLAGCATTPSSTSSRGRSEPPSNAGAAQLWAQNCAHCHNIRTPSAYSDMQWDVVMLHMRIRGNLTAEDHRAILAFLKSAH
ncbi:MAG: hypothetical protein HY300_01295 [Verrucomicrobia bacterium]|nr:hypothetical protein [Verrucomicrobiota bacterium]